MKSTTDIIKKEQVTKISANKLKTAIIITI